METINAMNTDNWLYIISISLQFAGAMILINNNFSLKRDKLIGEFVNSSRVTVRNNDKQHVQYKKSGLVDLFRQRLLNNLSLIYLLISFGLCIFGQVYPKDNILILSISILFAVILICLARLVVYLLVKYLLRQKSVFFDISTEDMDHQKVDADFSTVTNDEIDQMIL